jgi:hypothetical protein
VRRSERDDGLGLDNTVLQICTLEFNSSNHDFGSGAFQNIWRWRLLAAFDPRQIETECLVT